MGKKIYVLARPAAKRPRWCAAWWPRDNQKRLRWVYLRNEGGWTTIPDDDCLIAKDKASDAIEEFLDEYERDDGRVPKFQFRRRSSLR